MSGSRLLTPLPDRSPGSVQVRLAEHLNQLSRLCLKEPLWGVQELCRCRAGHIRSGCSTMSRIVATKNGSLDEGVSEAKDHQQPSNTAFFAIADQRQDIKRAFLHEEHRYDDQTSSMGVKKKGKLRLRIEVIL